MGANDDRVLLNTSKVNPLNFSPLIPRANSNSDLRRRESGSRRSQSDQRNDDGNENNDNEYNSLDDVSDKL